MKSHGIFAEVNTEIGQMADDGCSPAPLRIDGLNLGLSQMRMQPHPKLLGEASAAHQKVIAALPGNGGCHGDADAPTGRAMPEANGSLGEFQKALGGIGLNLFDRLAQIRRQNLEALTGEGWNK
jgi:hypothetical protein